MGLWDRNWVPDRWWAPVRLSQHFDRGDGEGETMLCFVCWALNNWSEHHSTDRSFYRAHDRYTDIDRAETEALRPWAPHMRSTSNDEAPFYDARVRMHASMVRRRPLRAIRHDCFCRRWFF